MSDESTTILLSAAGGMPSKGVIDRLHETEATIIGVDADPYSYGLVYLDDSYVVPRGDEPSFVESLLEIVRRENVDALLLSLETEVLSVSEHRERFEAEGCVPLLPSHRMVQRCADKQQTHRGFTEIDIPTPEIYDDVDSAEYPCIVKPRHGRGSTGVNVAKNEDELRIYTSEVNKPIIQEYVPGTEYTVDVLTGHEGDVLSVVPRERIGVESGKSVTGKTVADEEIREYSRRIASLWKLFGPSCIQCIRGEEGLRFIEVNTRFGGGAILSMRADQELVPNLLNLIRGLDTTASEGYENNLIMLRNYEQMFVDQSAIYDQE